MPNRIDVVIVGPRNCGKKLLGKLLENAIKCIKCEVVNTKPIEQVQPIAEPIRVLIRYVSSPNQIGSKDQGGEMQPLIWGSTSQEKRQRTYHRNNRKQQVVDDAGSTPVTCISVKGEN